MNGAAEEMFETLDEAGRVIGVAPRFEVHRHGMWHRAVNVIAFTDDDNVVIQKRSDSKDVCPGIWDLTVAEHLQPGETFSEAAQRGLAEELSLHRIELVRIGSQLRHQLELREKRIRDYEVQALFVGKLTDEPVVPGPEVASVRQATLEEIREISDTSPADLTPWFRAWLAEISDSALLAARRSLSSPPQTITGAT